MPLDKPFQLTPHTGERLRDVQALVDDHNLRMPLTGHGVMETSLGRNLQHLVMTRVSAALGRADAGLLSADQAPVISASGLQIGGCVRLQGEAVTLGEQTLPLGALGLGEYAVVVETWRALVGPTAAGRASEPQLYAAVTDAANKPSATALYPAGCVDLAGGPSDAPLVTATVQTQKFEQWQHRVRLIPNGDLSAYLSNLIPLVPVYPDLPEGEHAPGAAYTHLGDGLFRALLPDVPASYARAYDRRLYAFKLALVRVGASGSELVTRAPSDPVSGAPLAVVLPGRLALARETAAALAAQEARLTALEAARGALDLLTNEPFAVADEALGGSAAARTVPFPQASGALPGVTHDAPGAPAELRVTEAGRVRVTASVTFAASLGQGVRGVRLLVNGARTRFASVQGACEANSGASVNLSAELEVAAGQRISLEVVQRSGGVLLVTEAALSISRIR